MLVRADTAATFCDSLERGRYGRGVWGVCVGGCSSVMLYVHRNRTLRSIRDGELRSCMEVEVDVLGSPVPDKAIVRTVSVDVKQHCT